MPTMPTTEELTTLEALAKRLFAGKAFPDTVRSVDTAFAILLKGWELGMPAMAAAAGIAIVSGKVSLGADATAGACLRHRDICLYFSLIESTGELARYETRRAGAPAPVTLTYTIAQAKTAGLTGSSTWQKHAPAMLRARCAAALARAVYPDLVAGCYDPDEAREISGEYARVEPALAAVKTAAQTNPRDLSSLGIETQPPALPKRESALDGYRADLARATCLHDAAQNYRLLSQRLHAEDAADTASEALAEWLDAGGYALTATEQRACERGDYPREMLDLLDAVAECSTGADVVRWWGQTAHVVEALGAHAKAAKLIVAKTYCARIGDTSKSPAKVFAAALTPPTPPTGTDSSASARNDGERGDDTMVDTRRAALTPADG